MEGALERLEAGDRAAKQVVLSSVTVPETYLFRHPEHFKVLTEHALAAGLKRRYRVLSAGCATGEEAWSAAAVLDRVGRATGLRWEVIGWDLDAERIARARAGQYSAWSARNGFAGYEGAFERRGRGWYVHPRLRGSVSFECVNLTAGPTPQAGPFDAVFLRNVAIYWVSECVRDMINKVADLVTPGGLLLMGAAEPEALDRAEWTVEWCGAVQVATRRPSQATRRASVEPVPRSLVSSSRSFARTPGGVRATAAREVDQQSIARSREQGRDTAAPRHLEVLPRVKELADRGRYLDALALLDTVPPTPEAELHYWRGVLCLSASRPDEALSCLRKAVFLEPSELSYRQWLAVALSVCGHHRAAAREHRNLREISA
ncbi:MAG: CheR family methyltransferase [Enhygromyxa sp.]